jgi:hypothetical protein
MLIALLAVLGVDLIVLVILAAGVLGRRRWLKRQPGEFTGAIRVSSGAVHGVGSHWKRGSGRWVRDVLVWSKAPFMLRNELVPSDRLSEQHQAQAGEVKRLGDEPFVIEFASDGARIELAARGADRALVTGRWAPTTPAPALTPPAQSGS